jgi:hypothetical protein
MERTPRKCQAKTNAAPKLSCPEPGCQKTYDDEQKLKTHIYDVHEKCQTKPRPRRTGMTDEQRREYERERKRKNKEARRELERQRNTKVRPSGL